MKNLFSLFVALTCAIHLLAYDFEVDGIYYNELGGDSVAVTPRTTDRYSGSVIIPETVTYSNTTYRVTTIGNEAFSYCYGLTSVTIGNSVTTIGEYAFHYCPDLTSVTIGNSVTTIGNEAFSYCYLLPSITIPNSVKTIGEKAFSSCSGLTSVTIPNSVTTIGNQAFSGCRGLTSVTIPNSVTTIGNGAFWDVNNIVYSGTATGSPWRAKCVNGYVDGYLVYSDANKTKLCGCSTAATGEIVIPNSVTTIGEKAFYDCSGLTSVTIPNSVTTIGSSAFDFCTGLTSITIPSSVTTIESSAFSHCHRLTSVTIPNSVTTIREYAFHYCKGLTSVTIPNSVTKIGHGAFWDCSGLTSVTIGNSVTTIGYEAFSGCSSLTSVTIPNSVTTIGEKAFSYCYRLPSITIPNSVKTIGELAFGFVNNIVYNGTATGSPWGAKCVNGYVDGYLVYSDASKTILCGCSSAATGEITIPNSVTTIENEAFYFCSGLTSVTIGNSVTTIGENAFNYCKGLTSVTIPNSVTTIGGKAFYECTDLTSVTIGNSVTTIGEEAFYNCRGLTSITSYATTPPACGSYCFNGVYIDIPVYVPSQSVAAYKQANEWKGFMNILIKKRGQCGEDLYWQYNDGILVISGTGAMYDYTLDTAPWMLFFQESISSLVINNGCTSIGNFAFYGLSNKNLKTIDIPNSVEQIGQYAFANCAYLKNLYLGLSLEKISANAFANDERLIYITCYAIEPPLLDESAFVNYDAYLSVPCESQADYKVSKGWKLFNKENISCIGAKETPITTDDVTVTPEDDKATLVWPADDQAAGYSIEISKDGVVFCTLKFNAQGQLIGIAFAPSRDGELRTMPAAEMTAKGWQFTVTGLTPGSKYAYTVDVINAQQQSIKQYTGEFTTTGGVPTGINGLTIDNAQGKVKMIIDNQLFIFRGNKIYNAAGVEL